ncbi:MAG: hypothetical protein ABIU20_10325, partial [Blastocatellia bacterium]
VSFSILSLRFCSGVTSFIDRFNSRRIIALSESHLVSLHDISEKSCIAGFIASGQKNRGGAAR